MRERLFLVSQYMSVSDYSPNNSVCSVRLVFLPIRIIHRPFEIWLFSIYPVCGNVREAVFCPPLSVSTILIISFVLCVLFSPSIRIIHLPCEI